MLYKIYKLFYLSELLFFIYKFSSFLSLCSYFYSSLIYFAILTKVLFYIIF